MILELVFPCMPIWCHLTLIWFDSGSYDHPSNWQTASCHCGVKIKQPRDKFLFLSTFCWACVAAGLPRAEGLRLWRMHFAGRSKFNNQPAIHCDGIPQSIERVKGQLIQDEIMDLDCWLVACELTLRFQLHRRQVMWPRHPLVDMPYLDCHAWMPLSHRDLVHACLLASPAGIDTPTHTAVCLGIHLTTS